MNSADGLSYRYYSQIYDLGRELADKEYQQGIKDFAKWLSEQGYLTQIEYDMNEDFEGNIIWSEFEIPINTEDVITEYFQQLKEQNNDVR